MRQNLIKSDKEEAKEVGFAAHTKKESIYILTFSVSGITAKSTSTTSTLTPTETNYMAATPNIVNSQTASTSLPLSTTGITVSAMPPSISEDPFGSAPFSLPPGLREKAASLRKTGGKA